jgi:hypothetical protein
VACCCGSTYRSKESHWGKVNGIHTEKYFSFEAERSLVSNDRGEQQCRSTPPFSFRGVRAIRDNVEASLDCLEEKVTGLGNRPIVSN